MQFNGDIWNSYNSFYEIREVLEGLLSKDVNKRWSAKKALKHKLFHSLQGEVNDNSTNNLIRDNMTFRTTIKRRRMNIIKRGMLLFIATRLLPE